MRYLPAQAQDLLFERIHSLSADGSWLASNVPGAGFTDPERVQRQRDEMRRMRAAAAKLVDAEITDFDDLWYPEERTPVDGWLREHGWDVVDGDLLRADGSLRPQHSAGTEDSMPPTLYVSAQRRARDQRQMSSSARAYRGLTQATSLQSTPTSFPGPV